MQLRSLIAGLALAALLLLPSRGAPLRQPGPAPAMASLTTSGQVDHAAGSGLGGATVGTGVYTTTTGSSGSYTLQGLPAGTYALAPAAPGRILSPATRTVSVTADLVHAQGTSSVAAPVTLSPPCRRAGTWAAKKPANVTLRPGPVTHLTSRVAQAEGSVAGEFLGNGYASQPVPRRAVSDEVPAGGESVAVSPKGPPVSALAPQDVQASRVPLVFIPGIMGSRLFEEATGGSEVEEQLVMLSTCTPSFQLVLLPHIACDFPYHQIVCPRILLAFAHRSQISA